MDAEQIIKTLAADNDELAFLNEIEICCDDLLDSVYNGYISCCKDRGDLFIKTCEDETLGVYYITFCPFCAAEIKKKAK